MSVAEQFRGKWRDGWYVVPHQVLFGDIDAYGHVNNAVFFTYFEWARTLLWFELVGFGGARDLGFIVAHAECDFKLQIELEPIDICIRVGEMRNSSFDTHYELRKSDGGIAATGRVVTVLYDWERQEKMPITDAFRRKVSECSQAAY